MHDPAASIRRKAARSLFAALTAARQRHGGAREILIDGDERRLTYNNIVQGAFALGSAITRRTRRGEKVGIMLPTGAGSVIAFFALLAYGRIPAMLNFTAGSRNIKAACHAAEVKTVLTARRFIEVANLEKLIGELEDDLTLVHLEDVRENLTALDKARAAIGTYFPGLIYAKTRSSAPGVILFTSGTEGAPKGVVLSHSNVLANIHQIDAHVTLLPNDIFFNPLPTFHCYGLTAGTLFPLITGRQVVLHPSPLQTKIIPARIRETGATVLFATDTFLQQYARAGGKDDLRSLRFAVCGAERVRDETRAAMRRQFELEVLEGYGVTEAAPVIAVNQPDDIRSGTVGTFLPGMEARVDPVEGLEGGGRLYVRGPNVMQGYLSADRPGEIQPLPEGWHDTGDVVSIDEEGYISIRGRVKRFAKIGGEMVSLSVVENCASATWPDHMHAAVTVPDRRKGEQIILVTETPTAETSELRIWAQRHGVPELAIPRKLFFMAALPVLGTGKIDYVAVERFVTERLRKEEADAALQAADD